MEVDDLYRHANSLSLRPDEFRECFEKDASKAVDADVELAHTLKVFSTPTFFVGERLAAGTVKVRRRIVGAIDVTSIRKELNTILNEPSR